ncbi:MAG: plastocyanin/azurin family copper-binding protein [Gemmatimonadota bacterium]
MRSKFLLAGLVVVLAACGEKKAETPAVDTTAMNPAPPAGATGATHDVNMTLDGAEYKFVPASLTIKAGDVVVFHDVTGGPHNVQFYADSIPAGAAAALAAGMPDKSGDLASPMVEAGATYSINFANAPAGDYKFYCLPHTAMGMKGQITVQ